jgi:hypothetical protein
MPAAVVADADQLDAAFFELDLDRRAARIECVFEQLLEHRSRAVDDLAGGDLADQQIGQPLDGGHCRCGRCGRCGEHGQIIPRPPGRK